MNSLFTYFFLGVSLAAPIGPVKATLLNTGVKNGFYHAWFFGIGAIVTDVLYMLMVYFGVAQFIDSPYMKTFLWSFGFFVLMYTGIENLLTLHSISTDSKFRRVIRLRHSMLSGFLMALLNPLTILFWLGIYGSILVGGAGKLSEFQIIICSLTILLGVALVDFIMSIVSSGSRKLLSIRFLKLISLISSLSMIGFGIYFGIQAYHSIF
ncbi:threonine/homoserine/homoserine lactone efflux protein [Psychrobacillus insolitus]|jgi:threonine/homoserine/homoserine lactone efflux protein|uniref:Threonine/homoserine/homoserine lactone efflux protein n=1 Tax=Psychrobacillus insolitus TaxID=1461 RepID=A0A2W7MM12_9BACI|nr:LysE family transporter [Psychrobacillus insolitus]PZX07528.1 threonine/homoserine/homoserine lactone efflux protein [Psychrobacillus insolitus]